MKNSIILHGTGDRPDMYWFPYLKGKLEEKGYEVWLPQLPEVKPNLADWLPFVLNNGKFGDETLLIGHSAGSQLILSILENLDVRIKQAVLVSGYSKLLRASADIEKNEVEPDWENIKGKAKQFVFINSDNDPWECNDSQGRIMLDHLGGIQVIPKGEGHMGSGYFNQPYNEHPLLVKLLDF
jgi:uncharacterized protein